jgi:shikimate dehydrogenase
MPLKEEVVAAVDELSATAAALGAVNTLTMSGGRIRGDNTDGAGLVRALEAAGTAVTGRTVVVLGAGGSARAAILALAGAGASSVVVVNRHRDRAEVAAALAGAAGRVGSPGDVEHADVVVHATPVGMAGGHAEGQVPNGADLIHSGQTVVDLVYHPLRTPLLAAAAAAGATALDGLGTLVHQAALQFEAWTGVEPPVEAMERAAREG